MAGVQQLTLGDICRENSRRYRTRAAFVTEDGVTLTYDELDLRVTKLANGLEASGVGEGGRLLWLGQNSFRVLELILAASKIGASVCAGNWRSTVDELLYVLEDWAPALVVWQHNEVGATITAAREQWGGSALWVRHDSDGTDTAGSPEGPDSYESLLASGSDADSERPIDTELPVIAIYTAGFAGRPRAAMLSSNNLIAMATTSLVVREFTADDRMLVTMPAFHIMYCSETLPVFLVGGLNVFVRRVHAAGLCRLISKYQCTRGWIVSITREQMIEYNKTAQLDLSSMLSTGDDAWMSMVAPDTTRYGLGGGMYGQTEISGIAVYAAFGPEPLGVSGRPGPYAAVRIWDEDGLELPVGAVGEIVVRGTVVMEGYRNDPEGTSQMEKVGWRRTNDLGRREQDGSITFVAPKSRVVKSGVENIYPIEVERCISAIPGVVECGIIGVPDPKWIQAVKAVVVLEQGTTLEVAAVIEHCMQNIASYKKPKYVEFVDELPKKNGVVDYEQIDARFGGGNYPGGSTPAY